MNAPAHRDFTLEPEDIERLANLAGPFDAHLRQIELKLGVEIANRGNVFRVTGPEPAIAAAQSLLTALYEEAATTTFDTHAIHLRLNGPTSNMWPSARTRPRMWRSRSSAAPCAAVAPTRPNTCTRSPPTTSISASVRPGPARPSWR
ncbi:hypothetical protein XAB3213_2600002 [Xanthomonas citri pv. bilvae]|nr:hypothetical protein XAB3213_2600002 [Xanthomonas citri pv. bilvae]